MLHCNHSWLHAVWLTGALVLAGCGRTADVDALAKAAAGHAAAGKLQEAVVEYKSAIMEAPDRSDLRVALARLYVEAGSGLEALKELNKAVEARHFEEELPVLLGRAHLLAQKYDAVLDGKPEQAVQPLLAGRSLPPATLALLQVVRGHAHWALGEFDAADKAFDEALALDGALAEALAGKGLVRQAKGDSKGARTWYDKALAQDPKSTLAWSNIAVLEQRADNLGAAEAAYKQAIASHRNHADDLFGLMLVHLKMSKLNEAEKDFEQYKRISSRKHLVAYGQGLLEFHRKKYNEANEKFTEALAKAPEFIPALTYSGLASYLLGKYEQAQSLLSRVHEKEPGSVQVMRALALTRVKLNDFAGARALATQVLEAVPDDKQSLNILTLAAIQSGDQADGLEALERASKADSDAAPAARMGMGMKLLSDGQFDEGFAEIEKSNELAPTGALTYGVMAFGYQQRGEFDKAKEVAREAQRELPTNPLGWNLEGGIALAQKDMAAAKAMFAKALEVAPKDTSAAHNLASIALAEGDVKTARSIYEETLKRVPGHQRTLLKLAALDESAGDLTGARERYERAGQSNPKNPEAKLELARFHFRNGNLDEARKLLEPLVKDNPESTEVVAILAELLNAQKQHQQALSLLKAAIVRFPKVPILRFEAGVAQAALGAIADAENSFMDVLRLGTNAEPLQVSTIRYLTQLKSFDAAAAALEGFRKLHGNSVNARLLEGALWQAQGKLPEAGKSFESILAERPTHREATLLTARVDAQRGRYAESTERLEKWVAKYPWDTQAVFQLANVYSDGHDPQRAIKRYQEVLRADPNHALAHNNLAWLLKDTQLQEALQHAEAAARLLPESGEVLDTLGLLQNAVGDFEKSNATLTKASRLSPDNLEIKLHLSEAQLAVGDHDAARRNLQQIVRTDEKSPIADVARERLKQW